LYHTELSCDTATTDTNTAKADHEYRDWQHAETTQDHVGRPERGLVGYVVASIIEGDFADSSAAIQVL
jgi:hypothetical protein